MVDFLAAKVPDIEVKGARFGTLCLVPMAAGKAIGLDANAPSSVINVRQGTVGLRDFLGQGGLPASPSPTMSNLAS